MAESGSPPVADRRWRIRLLVMDGVLVVLLGWLLYFVIVDRAAAKQQEAESGSGEPTIEQPQNP